MPLAVLSIGSLHLVFMSERAGSPSAPTLAKTSRFNHSQPDYSQAPTGRDLTCEDDPRLDQALLREGQRLGIRMVAGMPELSGKDASYRAEPGRLGTITLKQRPMSPEVRCMLISHEFIHVLQHLHGNLRGVPPLGWPVTPQGIQRFGGVQEAEAYRYQNRAGAVLRLLRLTPAVQ